jgi:hypothetical protein
MWHTIAFVAESRHVEAGALTEFALANQDKYAIATDRVSPEVNTWYVDRFVSDFRVLQDEKTLGLPKGDASGCKNK